MYLDVFQCEGCGNIYQDLVATNKPPPPVIGGMGHSTSFHLQVEARRGVGASHQFFKVLCMDCLAAVRTAIDAALARR